LAFRHHGSGRTGVVGLVDPVIDDLHALQVFLNDFFARHFDILLEIATGSVPDSIDHMFLHEYANLFCQICARQKLGHAPADNGTFCHIALTFPDHVLVRGIDALILDFLSGPPARSRKDSVISVFPDLRRRLLDVAPSRGWFSRHYLQTEKTGNAWEDYRNKSDPDGGVHKLSPSHLLRPPP
jgi:hypothetical protein